MVYWLSWTRFKSVKSSMWGHHYLPDYFSGSSVFMFHSIFDIQNFIGYIIPFVQSVLGFLFIITVLVFCHELGHFYTARKLGVKVEIFSIGYGKALVKWCDKHGTEWRIAWIPIGGYVMMSGDSDATSTPDYNRIQSMADEEKKHSLHFQPLWKKVCIVFAGPFANYVLAIVIFCFFNWAHGVTVVSNEVTSIIDGMHAAVVGIQKGDKVVAINDYSVTNLHDVKVAMSINNGEKILNIAVDRNGKLLTFQIKPQIVEIEDKSYGKIKMPVIGLGFGNTEHRTLGFLASTVYATQQVYEMSWLTLKALWQMCTGQRGMEELSGPLRIAQYSGRSFSQGMETVLRFIAIISLNLGLINLLPIPVLDGGRLLLYAIDGIFQSIFQKTMSYKVEKIVSWLGFFLLALLMIISTFNDLKNLLFSG